MLLFSNTNDEIIQALIHKKWSTIQELHTHIEKRVSISLPNFYKRINRLIKEQIIIKENGKLYLHNRRVLGFLNLADELRNAYTHGNSSINDLQEGQSLYHEASTIEWLDGVRWDRMLQISKIYQKKETSYVYQSRPYYALWMHDTEMAFFTAANKFAPVFFLSWNTKFLDLYGTEEYKKIWIQALASDKLPFLKEGYCVTVVWSYIFEVLYPKELTDYFNIFFESITDLKKFNSELFYRIFTMKASCKLTLRKDTIQATSIKNIFIKTFNKAKYR